MPVVPFRAVVLCAMLAGCDAVGLVFETAENGGTVYTCDGPQYPGGLIPVEFCYLDESAAKLSSLVDRTCEETGLADRLWVGLTNSIGLGCNYDCNATGPGCNAHNGCLCPP